MSPRDPNVAMSLPASLVLERLREDRDDGGQGVHALDLSVVAGPTWRRGIDELQDRGFSIGVTADGLYELGHAEPTSTRAPGVGRPSPPERGCSGAQASGALVDTGQPRLFDPAEPHWKAA